MHILLMYSTHKPSLEHIKRLQSISPSIQVSIAESEPMALALVEEAEVILGHRYLKQCLPFAKSLRWVQSTAGGVDRLPCCELTKKNILLTRMTLSAPIIARHAVTLAWSITRCLPEFWDQQTQGFWNPSVNWLPFPKRAVVFGTGSIGLAIAKILNTDGIEVIGVKKTVQEESLPYFRTLCDFNSCLEHLSNVDWCFLALPYTSETEGMFNEKVMRILPSHGVLVNVGRGETLITEDLCRVLREGHLGGAALDVIYPKPIAANDSLWKTPRLFLTPHIAAHELHRYVAIERFCEEQVSRFISNQPLINLAKF